jgi:outer membrane lipoprotein-sorting protein
MGSKFCFVIAFLTLFAPQGGASGQTQGPPPPQVIVKQMAARYAAASTYQDSGVVETVVEGALPRRSTDVSFKTFFTRPRRLRFEWAEISPMSLPGRSVIWSDGEKAYAYYNYEPGKVETPEDLPTAIAGATGVSLGSAYTVPDLLLKETWGFSLTELTKLTLKEQERFEGEECYVLEGYHPSGEAWRLWIGKSDFLLRKLRTRRSNGEFEEEIHRDIRVGASIADETYRPNYRAGSFPALPMSKEKEADVRHLLELILPRDRINQMLNDVIGAMKTAMPQVPEKVWQEVVGELHLDADSVSRLYLPIYDSYYTDDEIKQLITFYESPLGRKALRDAPLIEAEAARQGETIGRELIKRITEKLRAKGYAT